MATINVGAQIPANVGADPQVGPAAHLSDPENEVLNAKLTAVTEGGSVLQFLA